MSRRKKRAEWQNSKPQTPNSREAPNSKPQKGPPAEAIRRLRVGGWDLEIKVSLKFQVYSFKFHNSLGRENVKILHHGMGIGRGAFDADDGPGGDFGSDLIVGGHQREGAAAKIKGML